MQRIIKNYPKSPVRPLAQNVLDLLAKQKNQQGQPIVADSARLSEPASQIYKYDANAIHFFVIIVNNEKTNVDALKTKLSDFNAKNYDIDDLQVNSLLLDDNFEMVTVGNFENGDKAVKYFNGINESKYIFARLENTGDFFDFIISVDNYPVFYKSKNIQQYLSFFQKNYPLK